MKHMTICYLIFHQINGPYFNRVLRETASDDELAHAFRNLSDYLHTCLGKKVIFLFDEYDKPLHATYQSDLGKRDMAVAGHEFKPTQRFIARLLDSATKGNNHMARCVMTGVLRTAFESLVSMLNDMTIASLLSPQFKRYFGLTEDDIKTMMAQMGYEFDTTALQEIRRWYNGYQEGAFYNPWAINQYLHNYFNYKLVEPRNYWLSVGDSHYLSYYMKRFYPQVTDKLMQLMRHEFIDVFTQRTYHDAQFRFRQ